MTFGPLKCERPHCYRHIFTSENVWPNMEASDGHLWRRFWCHACIRLHSIAPLPFAPFRHCRFDARIHQRRRGRLVFKQPFAACLQYPRVIISCRPRCQQSVKSLIGVAPRPRSAHVRLFCKPHSPHYCVPLSPFLLPLPVPAKNGINFPAAAICSAVNVMKRLPC